LSIASALRSFRTICSGQCRFRRLVIANVSWPSGPEDLHNRCLTSSTAGQPLLTTQLVSKPTYVICHPAGSSAPLANSAPPAGALSPNQIRHAYRFDQTTFSLGTIQGDGSGQTIAIIDAYDDPTISADLQQFDSYYGIAAPPRFAKVSQTGSTTTLPGTDPAGAGNNSWELEVSLDVEWAHVLAPGANILLVEANSDSDTDLYAAVDYARRVPGVSTSANRAGAEVAVGSARASRNPLIKVAS
jgi:subtilase family serine protease